MRNLRPIIFIEILEGANKEAIDSIVGQSGYTFIWLESDRICHKEHAVANPLNINQALVPTEKISLMEETCKSLGMQISQ
jgi:hypothetical protein